MGSVGFPEIVVIFIVALIVLGPEKLPSAARQVGKAYAEFKKLAAGFEDQVRSALDDTTDASGAADSEPPPPTATRTVLPEDADVPPPRD